MVIRELLLLPVRLGGLLAAPGAVFAEAAAGRSDGLRDALWLLPLAFVIGFPRDAALVLLSFWDLGPREGALELGWALQRSIAVDLFTLAAVLVGLGVPLRLVSGLSTARALGVVAYCWVPLVAFHAAGAALRLGFEQPPVRFPAGEEWLAGLVATAVLAVVAFRTVRSAAPAGSATP
jgi:hypothetical protein